MGYFTETQAEASYIIDTKKKFTDGVFYKWIWSISGSDGMGHVIHSTTLTGSATLTQQKNEVKAQLTSSVHFFVTPTYTPTSSSFDSTITKLG